MTSPTHQRTHLPARHYALADTLASGQAFRWRGNPLGWESVIHRRWVRLTPAPGGLQAETFGPPAVDWSWLTGYLQTSLDLEQALATFPGDPHLAAATAACPGLRLLRQEPWECLASFILSSTKQIVQIQQIVELLCARYGDPVPVPPGHPPMFSFPSPQRLAALSESDLRACKMGFRAPYLRQSARMIADTHLALDQLPGLPLEQARAELLRLPGVGRKIADCVLLFGLGFPAAFPVDVWVLKALRQLYFPRRRPSAKKLLAFTETYFGPHAGLAQQYLFHYMRTRLNGAPKNIKPEKTRPTRPTRPTL